MPILPPINPPSSFTLQNIVNTARAYPALTPVLGASGWTQEPAISIATDVMQRILAEGMDWKWNRAYIPPFLTVALQQDYCTQVTDVGWLEYGDRIDINNSTNNGNLAPKPVYTMETVRDIGRTSYQGYPFNVSYLPNSLAFLGQWFPNTAIQCGYGMAMTPQSPIQQFLDDNGNILYIDSTVLGLNINSTGFTTTPIVLPTPNPYGVTGNTEPLLPANTLPGTTVQDGTVTWTVADPAAYCIRVAPVPAFSGLVWLVEPVYQRVAPKFTSLQQTLSPIPDSYVYLFRAGFMAFCYQHAGEKDAPTRIQQWEEMLRVAVYSADREREDANFYPNEGTIGQGSPYTGTGSPIGTAVGPAWPFGGGPF